MLQTIVQIGNSLGVIIPKAIRDDIGLRVGSKVVVTKEKEKIVLSAAKGKELGGVDAKFMRMVDQFATEHKDVLKELAKR